MSTSPSLAASGGTPVISGREYPRWPAGSAGQAAALQRVLDSGAWGSNAGSEVHDFEDEFAAEQEASYATATVNGTIALVAALQAVGVGLGDEVIVPAYTFIATAAAPLMLGAIPVFADVNAHDHLIDSSSVASLVTERTAAIIGVHLAGKPADLDALLELRRRHGIAVIEDAAQAAGASYRGRRVGSIGDIGTFSFQSSKNMTAGEGGIMLTEDERLAERLYSYVNVGRTPGGGWYEHVNLGYNLRMTEFQGALLRAQLLEFPTVQAQRERGAARLDDALAGVDGLVLPAPDSAVTEHGRHLYLMRLPALGESGLRDAAVTALRAEGISGAFSGYVPLHRNSALLSESDRLADRLGLPAHRQQCPVTDRLCSDTVWLDQRTLLGDDALLDGAAEAVRKVLSATDELEALCEAETV